MIQLVRNSKLDLIRNVKFVKHLFRIQNKKDGKQLLWNQVKSRIEPCYSELVLIAMVFTIKVFSEIMQRPIKNTQ